MGIDWTKPLESAVDGTPLVFARAETCPDEDDYYHLVREDGLPLTPEQLGGPYSYLIVRPDGSRWLGLDDEVLVRNRAEKRTECCHQTVLTRCPDCPYESAQPPSQGGSGKKLPTPESPTLRDRFPMAALAYLAHRGDITIRNANDIATLAAKIADAMMQERSK